MLRWNGLACSRRLKKNIICALEHLVLGGNSQKLAVSGSQIQGHCQYFEHCAMIISLSMYTVQVVLTNLSWS